MTLGPQDMNMKINFIGFSLVCFICGVLAFPQIGFAQSSSSTTSSSSASSSSAPVQVSLDGSILRDRNGSGVYEIEAYGDSITRGLGDFVAVGEDDVEVFPDISNREAGYPLRVETFLGVSVRNEGIPGEILNTEIFDRFIHDVPQTLPDLAIISGGANDANDRASTNDVLHSVQTMINVAQASGVDVMLVGTPPTCCNHENLVPYIDAYTQTYRYLASVNEIPFADTYQAFANTCEVPQCYLLNLEEGLHPNIEGYDVMGETVTARMLNIDLFAPDGAQQLESRLNLTPGSVRTQPTPTL